MATEIDPKLLSSLVCPLTQGPLDYNREYDVLISKQARMVFPIRDGAPIMLVTEAVRIEDHPATKP
jgi:uncharacterized protein YbaR (Trm112 family)